MFKIYFVRMFTLDVIQRLFSTKTGDVSSYNASVNSSSSVNVSDTFLCSVDTGAKCNFLNVHKGKMKH